MGEQLENVKREMTVLTSHRSALETSITEMTTQKDKLAFEVEDLLRSRHLRQSTTDGSEEGAAEDLRQQLDQIKDHFREEVSIMQRDRDALGTEVIELRALRDKLAGDVSRLTEENRQLEVRSEQIAKQLVASADSLATESIEASPDRDAFPNMHELVRSLSGGTTASAQVVVDTIKPLGLPPPPTAKPHGPRRDERGERAESPKYSAGSSEAAAAKKSGWKGALKSNMVKASKLTKATLMGSSTASLASSPGGASVSSFKASSKNRSRTDLKLPEKGEPRAHSFTVHSYMSPRKCDLCHEKLWGKEMRCEDCGYHCHQKCAPTVGSNCHLTNSSDMLAESAQPPVFGMDLTKLLEMEESVIPSVVQKCVQAVEQLGMDFEGIYRKSGPLTQINKIIGSINRGEEVDLIDEGVDIMAVTSVLKQYFRDLPDPLIPGSLYSVTLEAVGTEDEETKRQNFVGLLDSLPRSHYRTLAFLMHHLHRIQTMSAQNLMSPSNLGVVFGPTLMRPPSQQELQLDMAEASLKTSAVEYLVRHAPELFEKVDVGTHNSRESVSPSIAGTESSYSPSVAPPSRAGSGLSGMLKLGDMHRELPPVPAPTRADSLVNTVVGSINSLDPERL
ncbi:hypothetical protein HDV00_011143 [Rhizophlyctis rosea]|nr:hypothetical protein HDV00_011143 [Rhizophlyctis rosea]